MQNEIQSYSFPLAELPHSQTALISSLRSRHFVVAASAPTQSLLHLFKYQEDNPKKSSSISRQVEGVICALASAEDENKQMTLAVSRVGGQYRVQEIKTSAIGSNERECMETIHSQSDRINSLFIRKDLNSAYLAQQDSISILDFEKSVNTPWVTSSAGRIGSLTVDPIHEYLTYTLDSSQIVICDKKSNNQKFTIRTQQPITNIDYNPNKQYYLLSCHHEGIKFWDIRKGDLPVKTYDDHHNLLVHASYNHSHDELIACSYDDGSVGLLRLCSVSSSPQTEIEDTLVKLYDQHEDSVYKLQWSSFSPWIFASLAYNAASLVINLVPSVEKYRILL